MPNTSLLDLTIVAINYKKFSYGMTFWIYPDKINDIIKTMREKKNSKYEDKNQCFSEKQKCFYEA